MKISQVVTALECERQWLREFHNLSKEQLLLLESLYIEAVGQVPDQRADLLLELAAIEATLGTWIDQVRNNSMVSHEVLDQLHIINKDIVNLAGQVIELDEQTYWRLIKANATAKRQTASMGSWVSL